MAQHKIIIRQHRPWQRAGIVVLSAMAATLLAFGLYQYTRHNTVADFEKATSERDRLMGERRELTQQLRAAKSEASRLRDELAYAQQSRVIDGDACASIKATLGKLEGETASLREQLAFYRGIASPSESKAGLRVQELKIRKSDDVLHYDLVLIQSVRDENRIAGKATMVVNGQQAGKARDLDLLPLVTAGDKSLVFSFKYFQEFSGDFRLPTGFRPQTVTVTLKPEGDHPDINSQFKWTQIESQQERSSD